MAKSGSGKSVTDERWHRIDALLSAVLEQQAGQRASFLERECAGDEELKKKVELLLRAHEKAEAGHFLEQSATKNGFVDTLVHNSDASIAGRRIGAYRLIRQIGHGGMGTVYLAERADEEFRKRVALKVIKRGMDTDAILKRFRRERQILASLEHPNIAMLLDGGTAEDGLPYFVMEYVEGQQLLDYCDSQKLPVHDRLVLFQTICSAVQHAHQNLVVHRDLKPGNILITDEGIPKLVDFGIAKILQPEFHSMVFESTRTGERVMTPAYASPEQIEGKPITAASDIYSLGLLLYELLCGRRPFRDRSESGRSALPVQPLRPSRAVSLAKLKPQREDGLKTSQSAEEISSSRRTTPAQLRRQLTGDLDGIVLKAMEQEPHRRYSSAQELSEDIQRHLVGLPIAARKGTALYRTGKYVRRYRAHILVGSIAIVVGIWAWKGPTLSGNNSAHKQRSSPLLVSALRPMEKSSPSARADLSHARPLTDAHSCPFGPIFVDTDTLVYDTRYSAQWGLFAMDLQRQTTRSLTPQQKADNISRGRTPTEILYRRVETTPGDQEPYPKIAYYDLATGSQGSLELPVVPTVFAGGAMYYVRPNGNELRRLENDVDESILAGSPNERIGYLVASPDQKRLALSLGGNNPQDTWKICFIDLTPHVQTQASLRCPMSQLVPSGRVSFSSDSRAFYYAAATGIHRFEIAAKLDEEIVPGVFAYGGIATSPDGRSLVYSDCRGSGPLLDISSRPANVLFEEELPMEPTGGPDGLLAYIRNQNGQRVVVVRDKAGATTVVSALAQGKASSPAIDSTGSRVTYAEKGSGSGIYVVDTHARSNPEPVTSDSHDGNPAWTKDGRVVFQRRVDPGVPFVYVVDPNTGEARQAHPKVRRVVGSNPDGLILLSSDDKRHLYLWDVDTAEERPVSLGKLGTPYIMHAALSPKGDFVAVQTGMAGRTIWKVPLDSEEKAPEKIFSADEDASMSSVAVLSDGRIIVGVRHWRGQLHLVPAKAGEVF